MTDYSSSVPGGYRSPSGRTLGYAKESSGPLSPIERKRLSGIVETAQTGMNRVAYAASSQKIHITCWAAAACLTAIVLTGFAGLAAISSNHVLECIAIVGALPAGGFILWCADRIRMAREPIEGSNETVKQFQENLESFFQERVESVELDKSMERLTVAANSVRSKLRHYKGNKEIKEALLGAVEAANDVQVAAINVKRGSPREAGDPLPKMPRWSTRFIDRLVETIWDALKASPDKSAPG